MTEAGPCHVVFGHLIIDDLRFPDGSRVDGQLGGAGTYAALGAALASGQRVGLVSGVGRDLDPTHRAWLASWEIDTSALVERGERTPRSRVVYRQDETRTEQPVHGEVHFASMAPSVHDLPADWVPAGVYVFARHDDPSLPAVIDWARRRDAPLMWEIAADSCHPATLAGCGDLLRAVDLLSINLAEARALTGATAPIACLRRLRETGARLITLRMGADGALIADPHVTVAAEAVTAGAVVDPTGSGNCHSGAFLAAWSRTHDLERAAALAAASAAVVLGHHGVPPPRRPSDLTAVTNRAALVRTRIIPADDSPTPSRSTR